MRKALISVVLAFVFYSMNADGTIQRWSFVSQTACNAVKVWADASVGVYPATGQNCIQE